MAPYFNLKSRKELLRMAHDHGLSQLLFRGNSDSITNSTGEGEEKERLETEISKE